MKLSDWLDAEKGRTKAVADHFGVSLGAVTQWREGVPRERMRDLHAFTDAAVSYEDMLPAQPVAKAA
ncbi:hypothetical protein [Variovorax ginsengisoli]|uniref:Transcriptional regulator n=1 Tax=Variovorax ginsengisoli TaxID=363844 RepID=A0ABT8RZ29_9BURK|nr:hypothetical protein [Variovorax ginsengisoli]MDN8612759.1 hypothetical protein [Variovorax ginsengisoli]MDO1531929.1 hypothetical protein [Variovorax ginsengisoli]